MNTLVLALVAVLVIWMLACAWCGFRKSFVPFFVVLFIGLVLNMAWMMIGLDARFLEPNALLAQVAATLYAVCAFGFGWLIGRVTRTWHASKVEDIGV